MENKQVQKKDSSKVVLIVVILILLGVIGYLVFTNHEKEGRIATQSQKQEADSLELEKSKKELLSIQMDYQKMKEQRDALGLRSDSLTAKIQEIETLLKKARSNASNSKRLKEEIEKLRADLAQKDSQLQAMIASNDDLRKKYEALYKNDEQVKDSLNQISGENTELKKIIKAASVLKAEDLKITAINAKGKEFDDDVYKAKNLSKLKIAFNVSENKATKKGSKDIFIRVIEPAGSTLFQGDKVFSLNGKDITYTEKKTINYDQEKQGVSVIYDKGSAYLPGKYTVEVYADQNKIGEGNFSVK